MAFKSVEQYNEEKYGGLFRLQNDQDFADVIFLYQSVKDVLVADVHYIKSTEYSGYVHCCGRGCPACAKGIRVQNKLFIPLYNITDREIQFWDRSMKFEPQIHSDVFTHYPNPSEYVFRVTRNGVAGDINTRYVIQATANNTFKSFTDIMAENNVRFPDYYESICKDVNSTTLSTWLNTTKTGYSTDAMPDYTPVPRVTPSTDSLTIAELPAIDTDEELDDPVTF